MKRKDAELIFKQYVLSHLKNFSVKGDLLFCNNLNELLRGFTFDYSSFDNSKVSLNVFVQPLYLKSEDMILNFGYRLNKKDGNEWLNFDKSNFEVACKELVEMILDDGILFLDKITNAEDFYEFYNGDTRTLRIMEAWTYTSVYLKHKDAVANLDNFINQAHDKIHDANWIKEIVNEAIELRNIFIESPDKIADIFSKWSKFTLKHLQLSDCE